MLGIKAEVKYYNCKKLPQTHYSITPLFLPGETFFLFHWGHYSNWGEAPKFYILCACPPSASPQARRAGLSAFVAFFFGSGLSG